MLLADVSMLFWCYLTPDTSQHRTTLIGFLQITKQPISYELFTQDSLVTLQKIFSYSALFNFNVGFIYFMRGGGVIRDEMKKELQ